VITLQEIEGRSAKEIRRITAGPVWLCACEHIGPRGKLRPALIRLGKTASQRPPAKPEA